MLQKLSDELSEYQDTIEKLQELHKKLTISPNNQRNVHGDLSMLHHIRNKVHSIHETIQDQRMKIKKGEEILLQLKPHYEEVKRKFQDVHDSHFLTINLSDACTTEIENFSSDYEVSSHSIIKRVSIIVNSTQN